MDILMFKELVKSRVFPLFSIVIGSVFLASCSSSVSRFDFPMFGLSKSDDSDASTSSLNAGSRLGQGYDAPSGYSGGSGLAGFENDRNSNVVASGSSNYNSRNSYLPPQTAAPEVRAARYGAVNRSPASTIGRSRAQPGGQYRADQDVYVANSGRAAQPRNKARYTAPAMKPIREARRTLLPSEPSGYDYNSRKRTGYRPASRQQPVARTVAPRGNADPTGDQAIVVAPGETLYSISRRHNVSVVKLMELNELSDSNLSVGQRIMVPGSAQNASIRQAPKAYKPVARVVKSGTYSVRSGENFQSIARKLGVNASELADINGITDTGSIRAGEVLILPTSRVKAKMVKKSPRPVAKVQSRGPQDLTVRSVKTKTIKLGTRKSLIKTVAKAPVIKRTKKAKGPIAFRWPVRGRIIGKFGARGDGTHNDGINLAVPSGTRVKAAGPGIVAYAGSELKGYGNLVLIRHANDWVSAYAHNNKLLVKRGDEIKRGQIIARSGKSGSVEQPQIHFELRKASKPVDPTKYMAGT